MTPSESTALAIDDTAAPADVGATVLRVLGSADAL